MSGDYTEVTSSGWLSRLGGAIKGVLIGTLLFLVSFPVLGWNEYRAVKTARSLEEGGKQLVEIASDKIDKADDGKFVHLKGKADTQDDLADDEFGVKSAKTIRLSRKVEMYQWVESSRTETRKKLGGGEEKVTTYTYSKEWSPKHVDSAGFNSAGRSAKESSEGVRIENPPMPYQSKAFSASKVTLGAFRLPSRLVDKIHKDEPLPVKESDKVKDFVVRDGGFYKHAKGDKAAGAAEVGDVRVSFAVTRPTEVSLYGKQYGDTIEPYQTKAGDALFELRMGEMSGQEMIRQAESENTTMTWVLRLVGFVLMAVGIALVFGPLVAVADVIPFVGNLLGTGVAIFAVLIALPLTLLTIGLCWVAVRPMVGVPLVIAAALLIGGAVYLSRGRKKKAA